MKVFNEFQNNIKGVSLALGFFDGVHLGHQEVIKSAVNNGKSAVITFKSHPFEIFGKEYKYLNTRKEREKFIKNLGVDYLFELNFTPEMAEMSGEEYLKMLVDTFAPKSISTGFNHTFGKDKTGTPELLDSFQKIYGYQYFQVLPKTLNNEVVSSTLIKKYISEGKIEKANKMLGYEFGVNGTVVEGNRVGHELGFPTANILYPKSTIELPYGVYSTSVGGEISITNFGKKPTLGENKPVIETHILNFDKNIYNTDIEIRFLKKIRDEKKFKSIEELKAQINKDILECLK